MSAPADLLAAMLGMLRGLAGVPPRFLLDWPEATVTRTVAPAGLPVLGFLAETPGMAGPATSALADMVVRNAPALAWRQTYTAADFGAAFLDRYGWTEIAGLRGPIASERIAAGFILLGPDTEYPTHSHQAEELYVPLAGRARWQRGAEPWRVRAPGEAVVHAHWMPHAMRTSGEPLLALYVWRGGDLAQKSRLG